MYESELKILLEQLGIDFKIFKKFMVGETFQYDEKDSFYFMEDIKEFFGMYYQDRL
jgi:hypothetical protein